MLNRGIDTVKITALSNHEPGILNSYIRISIIIFKIYAKYHQYKYHYRNLHEVYKYRITVLLNVKTDIITSIAASPRTSLLMILLSLATLLCV